jgi:hypothetical protein
MIDAKATPLVGEGILGSTALLFHAKNTGGRAENGTLWTRATALHYRGINALRF